MLSARQKLRATWAKSRQTPAPRLVHVGRRRQRRAAAVGERDVAVDVVDDRGDPPIAGSHVAEQLPRLVGEDVGQDSSGWAACRRAPRRAARRRASPGRRGRPPRWRRGPRRRRRSAGSSDRPGSVDPLAAVAVQVAVAVPQRLRLGLPPEALRRSPGPPRTAVPGRLPASRCPLRTRTRSPPERGVAVVIPHIVPSSVFP